MFALTPLRCLIFSTRVSHTHGTLLCLPTMYPVQRTLVSVRFM